MARRKIERVSALVARAKAGKASPDEWDEMSSMVAVRRAENEQDERGDRFMFLRWGERRLMRLHTSLLVAPESGNLFAVMTACALSLRKDSQRMSVSAAEIGRRLNLKSSQLSRAVAALRSFDVLMFPEAAGKSQTFEMDARLVTRMDEIGRKAVAASQEARRRVAAGAGVVPLRVVAGEDAGPIDDERQPALV